MLQSSLATLNCKISHLFDSHIDNRKPTLPNSPNLSEPQGIAQSQAFQGVKSNLAPPSISKGPTQVE